uniref:Carboxylic ester hydrolase n=1 Tax=Cacopsylla melanoneura TaxID=428564 RepID=A0A8D8VHR2_9HEMI
MRLDIPSLSLLCATFFICTVNGETVDLSLGRLNGTVRLSRKGQPFHAFLAIPFARPPVGDLRFKDPVPHPSWSEERDASTEPPVCPQLMTFFPEMGDAIFGQEDCLYLNVYTPQLDSDAKLPVMVFIHGGGFLMGGASAYGAEYFMDHNVILVTIQYRIGILGFLSFGNRLIPGNLGLKDQVLAMQWVRDHIQNFGGDKDRVTLFGESAGGASVDMHLVSPLSKGLFHRAIMQSGTGSNPWAIIPQPLAKERANAFATLVGCPIQPWSSLETCLKELPVGTFVHVMDKFYLWDKAPMIRFGPVIEPSSSENNFLPQHPLQLPHMRVPVIIGCNFKEGGILGAPFCTDDYKQATNFNKHLDRVIPHVLTTDQWTPINKRSELIKKVKEFYLNNQPLGPDNLDGFIDMVSDIDFFHGAIKTVLHHKAFGPGFFYLYNYEMTASLNSVFGNCSRPLGVSHGDELLQLFPLGFVSHTPTEEEVAASEQLLHLWTSFARDGVPDHPEWSPVSSESIEHLYISRNSVAMQPSFFEERMKFVDSLPLVMTSDLTDTVGQKPKVKTEF